MGEKEGKERGEEKRKGGGKKEGEKKGGKVNHGLCAQWGTIGRTLTDKCHRNGSDLTEQCAASQSVNIKNQNL